ncbi:hypothetical protein VNO77_36190 [Canavalia gladiata]|uniref:TF-B3 domain-containing protein n=1 Tax=Canavalia gladiata TaxID=3824 RepID=A0AAN9PVJ1_CANGL
MIRNRVNACPIAVYLGLHHSHSIASKQGMRSENKMGLREDQNSENREEKIPVEKIEFRERETDIEFISKSYYKVNFGRKIELESRTAITLDSSMTFAPKKYPDFFKVFLPEQHHERMLIPDAFVKLPSLQGRIPKDVILRNRNGRVWRVKTHFIGDKLYFDDGWKLFREENSLEEADFLVFTYDGINEFKFKILELSTRCEKTMVKEEEEQGKEKENVIELEEEVNITEIKEKAEQGKEEENVIELEEEVNIEEDEVIEIKEVEEHEEFEDYLMEDKEEQTQEEDSEDDDYDDFDSDEYTDTEEENEGEYNAGNMRSQCHHRANKTLVVCNRKTAISSLTRVKNLQLGDYGVEAEMYIQPDNLCFVAKLYKSRPNELVRILICSVEDSTSVLFNSYKCCHIGFHIPANVIKDYSLTFPQKVTLLCCQCQAIQRNEMREYHLSLPQQTNIRKKYKEVTGELCTWKDGRLCIQGWTSFCRKNNIKENDVCLCEIVIEEDQIINLLRVHVLCAGK